MPRSLSSAMLFALGLAAGCSTPPAVPPSAPTASLPTASAPAASAPAASAPPAAPPAPSASPTAAAPPAIDAYLSGDFGERFHKRCLVRRPGPVSLGADGDEDDRHRIPTPFNPPRELVVVEETPHKLRVVEQSKDFRVAFFVRREDLQRAPVHAVGLARDPSPSPDPAIGARVAAGVALEEVAAQGDLRKLKGIIDGIEVEGWVPSDALGDVFEGAAPNARNEGDSLLKEGAVIVASPRGEVIARLPPVAKGQAPRFIVPVTAVPGAPRGYASMSLIRPHIEIRGMVAESSIKRRGPNDPIEAHGTGSGSDGAISDTPRVKLKQGTSLYARDGEERVGVALRDAITYDFGAAHAPKGFREIAVFLGAHGYISVYAREADVAPAP